MGLKSLCPGYVLPRCSRQTRRNAVVASLLFIILGHDLVAGQLSAPVADDGHISVDGNKFLQNKADLDKNEEIAEEAIVPGTCPQNVELKWMTEVSSSIYATPLITDLYSDGRKDIIVPSFVHYTEVLEAAEGAQAVGWPAFHKSTVHASPLLYDIDFDGVRDIVVTTYDGEVLFYKDTGEKLAERLTIPRLQVRKDWYKGLAPDPIDHSHPDISDKDHIGGTPRSPRSPWNAPDQGQGQAQDQPPRRVGKGGDHQVIRRNGAGSGGAGTPGGPAGGAGTPGGPSGGGKSPAALTLTDEVREQVQKYKLRLSDYRSKYGEQAAKQLLTETQKRNPGFYKVLMTEFQRDADKATMERQALGADQTQAAQAARRRLMAVDLQEGAQQGEGVLGAVSGSRRKLMADEVEPEPEKQGLSSEAAGSFEVFTEEEQQVVERPAGQLQNDDEGSGGAADSGGDGSGADDAAQIIVGHDEVEAALDADDILADLPFEYQYDEFGDKFPLDVDDRLVVDEDAEEINFGPDTTAEGAGEELDRDHYGHLYLGDYADLSRRDSARLERGWDDETFEQAVHRMSPQHVYVDAHVLATPAIADIDADGHEELVVPVSYFYDREYYDDPAHSKELGDIDITKYIASGVVVFDLRTRSIKWTQHLDLSTDTTTFKAYAYATPTLMDIDKDGRLEVVLGTSMGFLYVLDSRGKSREGWPLQMGEIQGQSLVLDINNDGEVEIVAADTRGNVAAFSTGGDEVWSRHVRSLVAQAPTAGDVNSDGELEVVFGTASGHIYAVKGATGEDIPNFPFRTRGRIHAPALITRLLDGPSQHIIVMSFDGFMYLVDGLTGCADSVDIGETSYSMVLADDLDGNGRLDLLVTTMNGNVYMFETPSEYHPLKAWTSQVMGPNAMLARHDYFGAYATKPTRQPRDVAGDKLRVQINIIDKRATFAPNGTLLRSRGGPYNVSVVLKGVGVREMNSGPQPVIGVADTFSAPGTYLIELPAPRSRSTATVHIELVDAHGLSLSDEFSLSFHMHFHKLLKWLVAAPAVLMAAGLMALTSLQRRRRSEDGALPSYTNTPSRD
mmetsp:Transcript_4558/g.9807  ORF Transcript_4558/g.9807 Transcript_4558/m.9807 type:complete len:1070 (-) Transcript_4558:202-3411(-)